MTEGGHPDRYLTQPPLALAHRGGDALPANVGIENSLTAVGNAVALGYRYIETDSRASIDGVAFAFHDRDMSRVSPDSGYGTRPFATLTAAEIRAVRLRGGERIATIAELLDSFPQTRFNIDVKTAEVIEPTVRVIEDAAAQDRVLMASFSHARLTWVRRLLPGVETSASPQEITALRLRPRLWRSFITAGGATCLQVPEFRYGFRIVTPGFIAGAHRNGMQVHVWTVDEPADMHRLLDAGVDGLITDRPDVLREVLVERGQWRT
ncbi:glycerophosphodiester phosphodiesterase family protein [Pseudactinotalea terrae]|uniref:glycerophosphodiester phosphodiesterase family protein n=1 Tax=Pseudactinotalea terrae TaxID=1743262 RepID=UPI0012E170EA|nr:glycerophosphodiester phosphodiesterase family protein [Pseudactinotalea terrae]